jgi:pumilio RNA-binding family
MKKVLINGDPSVQYLKLVLKQYPDLIVRIKNSDFG